MLNRAFPHMNASFHPCLSESKCGFCLLCVNFVFGTSADSPNLTMDYGTVWSSRARMY